MLEIPNSTKKCQQLFGIIERELNTHFDILAMYIHKIQSIDYMVLKIVSDLKAAKTDKQSDLLISDVVKSEIQQSLLNLTQQITKTIK